MEVFALTVDTLVGIWRRDKVEIKADSLEEAISKIINHDDNIEYKGCEYLYDTEVGLDPEDNNGEATLEIMNRNETIYSNENSRQF